MADVVFENEKWKSVMQCSQSESKTSASHIVFSARHHRHEVYTVDKIKRTNKRQSYKFKQETLSIIFVRFAISEMKTFDLKYVHGNLWIFIDNKLSFINVIVDLT